MGFDLRARRSGGTGERARGRRRGERREGEREGGRCMERDGKGEEGRWSRRERGAERRMGREVRREGEGGWAIKRNREEAETQVSVSIFIKIRSVDRDLSREWVKEEA
jgi:hypothetical protein